MPSTRMGTVCCSATKMRESLSTPSTDTCFRLLGCWWWWWWIVSGVCVVTEACFDCWVVVFWLLGW
jgi:hypothetical protein